MPTHQGQELLGLEVEQLVEVDAAEGELLEGALLAGLRNARHLLLLGWLVDRADDR